MSQATLELHDAPQIAAAPTASPSLPPFVKEAQAVFVGLRIHTLQFIKTQASFEKAAKTAINRFRWPDDKWDCSAPSIPEEFKEGVTAIIQAFIGKAESVFSLSAGVKIAIAEKDLDALRLRGFLPRYELRFNSPSDVEHLRADFTGAWCYLAPIYHGEKAKEVGLSSAARLLFKEFDLERNPPAFRGAKLLVGASVYWDDSYGLVCGWAHHHREGMNIILRGLRDFATSYGHTYYGDGDFLGYFSRNRQTPRGETFDLAEGLSIRPYKTRIEFRFEGKTAEDFQAFISTYTS